MKKLALVCLMLLGACSQNGKSKPQHVIDTSQETPYVFVISSASGSSSNGMVTLKAVPVVVYFSDRPHLVAGHLPLSDFIANWKSTTGTADESPNAVLSILDQEKASEVVLEISEPTLEGKMLKLKVEKASGELPTTFGPSSVFIEMKNLNVESEANDSDD